MAKKTKKTPENNEVAEKPVEAPKVPPVPPGFITCQLTTEEIQALLQFLNFSKDSYRILADRAMSTGDLDTFNAYNSRSQLSTIMYERLRPYIDIGEPDSREVH